MRASLIWRSAVVGAVGAVALLVGLPAWANSTISINSGNVPTTAAEFGSHECDPNQGGGPFPGEDVWVFVLPGMHDTSGDFVSVTANFGSNGTKKITAAVDTGNFDNGGPQTSKAWIVTPAGWTLTTASAEITGTAEFFNLTHTCPAGASPSPSTPPGSTPPSTPPGSTPPSTPTGSTPPSGSVAPTGSIGVTPSGGVKTGGGGGMPAGSLVFGLSALVLATGGGAALVLARRRRDNV